MGHATGRHLAEKIISAVHDNGIALEELQMLESDEFAPTTVSSFHENLHF